MVNFKRMGEIQGAAKSVISRGFEKKNVYILGSLSFSFLRLNKMISSHPPARCASEPSSVNNKHLYVPGPSRPLRLHPPGQPGGFLFALGSCRAGRSNLIITVAGYLGGDCSIVILSIL